MKIPEQKISFFKKRKKSLLAIFYWNQSYKTYELPHFSVT